MKNLTVKLKVKDDIEAYKVIGRLKFLCEVLEAIYSGKTYKFSKEDKSKLPKHFLREDFGKKSINE